MFRITPKTEDQIRTESLIDPGIYDFEVVKCEEKVSKSGNEMLKLTLRVWDMMGREHTVFDYLMDSIAYKVKHFCDTVGLEEAYNAGGFKPEECQGRSGKAKIGIKEDKTGVYPPNNSVLDYVGGAKLTLVKQIEKPKEDDIPGFDDDDIPPDL